MVLFTCLQTGIFCISFVMMCANFVGSSSHCSSNLALCYMYDSSPKGNNGSKGEWSMKTNIYKILIMTGLFAFCFILIFNGNKLSAKTNIEDLQQLASSVKKADGTIIEWSLYARESVQVLNVDQYILQYPEMEWTVGEDSLIGTLNTGTYSETIQIMNNQHNNTPFISYELSGTDWDEDTGLQASETASHRMKTLFNGEPTLFSCIKGEFNHKIDEFTEQSLNTFMQSLQAKEIESITEHNFRSISAYSSLFTQTLALTEQQMNIQLGLRNSELDNGTIFVIGTPILTIEY